MKMVPKEPVINFLKPAELIIRTQNNKSKTIWYEAIIILNGEFSFLPDIPLKKAKLRIGIAKPKEFIEKYINIYSTLKTEIDEAVYGRIDVITLGYDKEGVNIDRADLKLNITFYPKKEAENKAVTKAQITKVKKKLKSKKK